jgi:GntR family transcriptional regulator, transcriptional repressor for pyruvate dehydrogenase complex
MLNNAEDIKQNVANKPYNFLRHMVHSGIQPNTITPVEPKEQPAGPIDEPKRAVRIIPAMIKYIQVHNLVPGCKLPSQRELCQILRIGSGSLREALVILEAMGLVQSRQGTGWFVGRFDPVGNLKFLAPILEAYTDTNAEVIIETRMAIEPLFARRAAEYITKEGLKNLDQAHQIMIQAAEKNDFETFKEYDKSFHLVLAQESRSGILCVFAAMLNDLFVSYWTPLCVDYEFPVRVHQAILDAV